MTAESAKTALFRFIRVALVSCALLASSSQIKAQLRTTVTPHAGEDIAHPCEYEMEIPFPQQRIAGVFVIFERGPQSHTFYNDPEVRSFAASHSLAMMLPLHCAAAHADDMDVDPDKGLGRAFFAALDQLAAQSHHPELHTAPVIVLGFSGAGALAARMPAFAPRRVAAAVVSHAGQVPPLGLNTIHLSRVSLAVPQLIIVGGRDRIVGTTGIYDYFQRHWVVGAPWLFAEQNDAAHCCTIAAKPLILSWLNDVLTARSQKPDSASRRATEGYYAFFRKVPTGLTDSGGAPIQQAADLFFVRSDNPRPEQSAAGWLPSRETATLWQSFASLSPNPKPTQ